MRAKVLLIALLPAASPACGGTFQYYAVQTADASADIADVAADGWTAYVEAMIKSCRAKDLPTEFERRSCLGPAARADEVAELYRKIVSVQEVLYLALKEDARVVEVASALAELLNLWDQAKNIMDETGVQLPEAELERLRSMLDQNWR